MKFCTSCGNGADKLVRITSPGSGIFTNGHGVTVEQTWDDVRELCLDCVELVVCELPDGPDRKKLAQVLIDAGRHLPAAYDARLWTPTPRNVSKS